MLRLTGPSTRRHGSPRIRLITFAAAAALIVVACASSGASSGRTGTDGSTPAGHRPPVGSPGSLNVKETTAGPVSGGVAPDGTIIGSAPDGGGTGSNPLAADIGSGPLIVRTGSLALEVKDIDASLLQARARIVGLGGYVADTDRSNADDQAMALVTYRIPAGRWDDALDALHGLATRVVGEQTKSVEVTGQVLDLGARIDNLRATERALQAIMIQATKISDILEVQNQLTNVQGQIEQLSTEKAHRSDQAALGSLAVTYAVPIVAVAHVSSGWDLSAEIDRALAQLVTMGQGVTVAAIWLAVVGLPIVASLLLVAFLVLFVARRLGLGRAPATRASGLPPVNA